MELSREEFEIECFLEEFRKFQWFLEEFRTQFPKKENYDWNEKMRASEMINYIIDQTFIYDLAFLEFVVDNIDKLRIEYLALLN